MSNLLYDLWNRRMDTGFGQAFITASAVEENPASPAIRQLWRKYATIGNVFGKRAIA
jgi:hypothetical protein